MTDQPATKPAQQDLDQDPRYALNLADRRQRVARLAETLPASVLIAVEHVMGINE